MGLFSFFRKKYDIHITSEMMQEEQFWSIIEEFYLILNKNN
jgi:hypothetical protein